MRRVTLTLTLAAALAAAGCATMTVSSHIERTATFTDYLTYDWGPPDNLPVGDPRLDRNAFYRDYLMGAIEKKMRSRGYERAADPGQSDLLIHYHASVNQKVDVYAVDSQYGYCYGDCQPRMVDYELGTLIVDVVDRKTNKVIWRGWAQEAMNGIIDNQDRLEKQVDEGVSKMMLRLPTGGAAVR